MEIVDRELASPRFKNETAPPYVAAVREYILKKVAGKVAAARGSRGMYEAIEREDEWDEYTDLTLGASGKITRVFVRVVLICILFLISRRGQEGRRE